MTTIHHKKHSKTKPKIVALYLPQFHQTEYNSNWWGEGYTDWVACQNAKSLFAGHMQPRIPLDNSYYDLTDILALEKQSRLAEKYSLDGFAVYHYYSVGSVLLDKPLKLMRDCEEFKTQFYLFWANESWRRTWFGNDNELLWEQKYGDLADWRLHYEYCLEYFRCDKYMKIGNKPIFAIYKSWHFNKVEQFIDAWNDWARKDGFEGIYFVKSLGRKDDKELGKFSAIVTREPNYSFAFNESFFEKLIRIFITRTRAIFNKSKLSDYFGKRVVFQSDYKKVWQKIVDKTPYAPHVFPGAFVDWDATPRKGYEATIVTGASPEVFEHFFQKLYRNSDEASCPMIVLNAWNEWGEGAYLEPDEHHRFKYLEAIKRIKT